MKIRRSLEKIEGFNQLSNLKLKVLEYENSYSYFRASNRGGYLEDI